MARGFVAASNHSLDNNVAGATAVPLTIAGWALPSGANAGAIAFIGDKDTAQNYFAIYCSGGSLVARANDGGAAGGATKAFTSSVWSHFAGVFTSTTSRTSYVNGVAGTTETTSSVPTGIDRTSIGRIGSSSPALSFDGSIGEVGAWNVALDAAEIAALAAGVSPLMVRPASLIGYWPLIGQYSPEIDLRSRNELTVTGATAAAHPRVIYPSVPQWKESGRFAAALAADLNLSVTALAHLGIATDQTLIINGVERSRYYERNTLQITDDLNELPNTLAFVCFGFVPQINQIVRLFVGAQKEFEGTVTGVTEHHDRLSDRTEYSVSCTDYTWAFDAALITAAYDSQSGTAIAQGIVDVVNETSTAGFTKVNIVAGLPTVASIQFKMVKPSSALRQLCDAIGGDAYVDYDKDVHVFLTETDVVPEPVSVLTTKWRNFRFRSSIDDTKNVIQVEGNGSVVSAAVATGATTIPIDSDADFSASGGQAVQGNQILTYTALSADANNGTTSVGIQKGATAPTASIDNAGPGHVAGAVKYAMSYVSADGESEVSPVSGTVTGTQISAPIGPALTASGAATFNIDYACVLIDADGNETSLGTISHGSSPVTAGDPAVTVDLTNADGLGHSPWGVDSRVVGWRIYRRKFATAPTAPSGDFYRIADIIDPTHATMSYVDHTTSISVGTVMSHATVNLTGGVVSLSDLANGPSGTLAKKIYRTAAGASVLQHLATISDNTTTTLIDKALDSSLGAEAPSGSLVKTVAGSTSLTIADLSQSSEGSGWARVGTQVISFSGVSGASGIGTLTGIPASGTGSLVSAVTAGTAVTFLPLLKGVPASGAGAVVHAISAGEEINLLIEREDATSQATYGIRKAYVQDRRLSQAGAEARGDAELSLRKDPYIEGGYISTDANVRSGRRVTIDMVDEWGAHLTGTFTISKVRVYWDEQHLDPQREVTFSSNTGQNDLYRILRRIRAQQQQQNAA